MGVSAAARWRRRTRRQEPHPAAFGCHPESSRLAAVADDEDDVRHARQDEGADDLPAHIKASLLGASLNIPLGNGRLRLGTWQGIYLCEHRDYGGSRRLVVTAWGEQG